MAKFKALLAVALATSCGQVAACTLPMQEPRDIMSRGQNAVLAYPIAISNLPRIANQAKYRGTLRQTVLWRVVLSWRGEYEPGSEFTTRQNVDRSGMCGGGLAFKDSSPKVLTFSGLEPYKDYALYSIDGYPELFTYLQRNRL